MSYAQFTKEEPYQINILKEAEYKQAHALAVVSRHGEDESQHW